MAANVHSLVQYWKNFDLPRVQKELDVTATDLANRQDESDASRKRLVELSREFKKNTPEDIRETVAPLLKSFQTEVDNLCKRSKAAEAAFLAVYKKIVDVPDPVPVLEHCLTLQQRAHKAHELDIENKQLRETLNDYNQEFKDAKKHEVTIKQLQQKLQEYEERTEDTFLSRVHEKEQELRQQFQERERQLLESLHAVSKKLEDAEQKIAELQSALESTQPELFDLKAKQHDATHAKSDEMEIIMNDLERANQRAALAEKEVAQLKEQLTATKRSLQLADQIQKAPDMEQAVDVVARSSLEVELAAKEKEISQLVDDIQRLQSTISTLKETTSAQIAQLEEMLTEKNTIIRHLEEKLERQKDYEDIKRELSILKSMEFPADSAPNLPSSDEQGPVDAKSSPKPLDVLLLEKNKSLQNENSALKTGNSDVSDSAENPFLPPLQTVETFGSILGEEIVSTFTKLMKKEERNGSPAPPSASPDDVKAPGSQKPSGGTCSSAMSSTTTTTTSVSSSSSNSGGNSPYVNGNTGMKPVTEDTTSILSTTPTKEPSMENASFEKLQECLRHNVEKYINESLNTLSISRCVRELLSVHNIGQRLFAKYVLGLSQGTVSELLSKPKPWDKLTEKGRDSYRKMHAWAADESCIYLLKALVPRKGKDTGMTPFRQEDTGTEERIAQILSEAQQAMCNKNCKSLTSTTPPTSLHNGIGNLPSASDGKVSDKPATENAMDQGGVEGGGGENGGGGNKSPHPNHTFRDCLSSPRRCRKYENDDIPQEMVARIYQEELAKLMGQQGAGEEFRPSRDQYERTQEEIRQALSIYHQELSRLSQMGPPTTSDALSRFSSVSTLSQAGLLNGTTCANFVSLAAHVGSGAPRLDMPLDARMAARVSNQHEPRPGCCPQSDSLRHHGSAFSLVRPKTEPTTPGAITKSGFSSTTSSNPSSAILPLTETSPGEDMGSPLQRMQSITNSLLSQSSMPSLPTPPQRPSKAVLPPITQQQFDQYNNLNTEDIVKKVKEQLSQYSISQRLFGESVLGLSQGSVSDLLARPKPWHMLTQKGREPFIRMKIFLEDDNAVHKLVASQYKIAPEKLMRTGGFAGITPSPVTSSKPSPRPSEPSPAPVIKTETNRSAVSPSYSSHSDPPRSSSSTPEGGGTPAPPLPLPVSTPSTNPALPGGGSAVARRAHHTRSLAYMQPSVYEMAALTTDLDTQSITTRIKETLMAHNIGQKIFGEAVLGLSQGSVSELLSKPKPWHMLSIKGREPFIRMQLWLNDPHNVEKLQALKNERREANKRRRSNIELPETAGSMKTDNHVYNFSYAPSPTYPAAKKPRILFSEEQKEALRLAFSMDPYPSTATIEFLANELNLSVRTITNWFHNHRMRLKQHNPSASQDDQRSDSGSGSGNPTVAALPYLTGVREGAAFDPVHFRRMLSQRLLDLRQEKNSSFRGGSGMMVVPYGYMSYGNTGNSSPLSTQGDDTGTLDLSMSSQQRSRLQANKTDTSFSGADDRSSSEINDDSNMSQDQGAATEGSDHDSVEDQQAPLRSPTLHQKHLTEQWKRAPLPAPTVVPTVGSASSGSSSNRRKPAMPQWVNPGLEMSPDSDVQSDEEEEYDDSQEEIINGVCVRQTDGGFDLRMTKEETVRIEPAPAPDQAMVDHSPRGGALKSRKAEATTAAAPAAEEDDEEEAEEKEMDGVDAEDEEDEEEEEIEASDLRVRSVVSAEVELERRNNIKRLERSLNEQEESWDVVDADDDRQSNIEKMQQRLEKEDREDWEF